MTAATAPAGPPTRRRGLLARLGIDTAYVLVGFPLAVLEFCLIVTGLALGASTLVLVLGIPVLVATAFVARGLAEVERARMAPVLGRPRVGVRYRRGDVR